MNISKYKLMYISSFISGILVGVGASYLYLKKKFDEELEDKIFTIKLQYQNKNCDFPLDKDVPFNEDEEEILYKPIDISKQKELSSMNTNKPPIDIYKQLLSPKDRMIEEELKREAEEYRKEYLSHIQIIPPEKFGERDDYSQYGLTLHSDGYLVDEDGNEIENADDFIGEGSLDHFGEYEDDALHIKNDMRKCYVEILYDVDPFKSEVEEEE